MGFTIVVQVEVDLVSVALQLVQGMYSSNSWMQVFSVIRFMLQVNDAGGLCTEM